MKPATLFYIGTKLEFNNDGDICETVGSRLTRRGYCIIYESTKTKKRFMDTRKDILDFITNGKCVIK